MHSPPLAVSAKSVKNTNNDNNNGSCIKRYTADSHNNNSNLLYYFSIVPTTVGTLMYLIAHNELNNFNDFSIKIFGDFYDISLPINYSFSLQELLDKVIVDVSA